MLAVKIDLRNNLGASLEVKCFWDRKKGYTVSSSMGTASYTEYLDALSAMIEQARNFGEVGGSRNMICALMQGLSDAVAMKKG